ncbi:MAG: calycin-like domain-containing protein [Bacteroidaceae bacterium]|nr:calycin-like domain-containing protein [Bacteroidaceae bacterium]
MKKNYFYLLFMALCTVCMFTACSSDDDDNNTDKPIVLNDIIGTYKGSLEVLGSSIDEQLTVEKVDDSKVRVVLKDFTFGQMPIGTISAECAAVKDDKGTSYDIYGTAVVTVAMFDNAELPVTVDGECNGKELDVTISINEAPVVGSLEVDFYGKK